MGDVSDYVLTKAKREGLNKVTVIGLHIRGMYKGGCLCHFFGYLSSFCMFIV